MLFMYCRTGLMQGDVLNHCLLMMCMNVLYPIMVYVLIIAIICSSNLDT